jgi:hypothetical protein
LTTPPNTRPPGPDDHADERSPLFGSWGGLYAAVLVFLAALITLMYIFQVSFA